MGTDRYLEASVDSEMTRIESEVQKAWGGPRAKVVERTQEALYLRVPKGSMIFEFIVPKIGDVSPKDLLRIGSFIKIDSRYLLRISTYSHPIPDKREGFSVGGFPVKVHLPGDRIFLINRKKIHRTLVASGLEKFPILLPQEGRIAPEIPGFLQIVRGIPFKYALGLCPIRAFYSSRKRKGRLSITEYVRKLLTFSKIVGGKTLEYMLKNSPFLTPTLKSDLITVAEKFLLKRSGGRGFRIPIDLAIYAFAEKREIPFALWLILRHRGLMTFRKEDFKKILPMDRQRRFYVLKELEKGSIFFDKVKPGVWKIVGHSGIWDRYLEWYERRLDRVEELDIDPTYLKPPIDTYDFLEMSPVDDPIELRKVLRTLVIQACAFWPGLVGDVFDLKPRTYSLIRSRLFGSVSIGAIATALKDLEKVKLWRDPKRSKPEETDQVFLGHILLGYPDIDIGMKKIPEHGCNEPGLRGRIINRTRKLGSIFSRKRWMSKRWVIYLSEKARVRERIVRAFTKIQGSLEVNRDKIKKLFSGGRILSAVFSRTGVKHILEDSTLREFFSISGILDIYHRRKHIFYSLIGRRYRGPGISTDPTLLSYVL